MRHDRIKAISYNRENLLLNTVSIVNVFTAKDTKVAQRAVDKKVNERRLSSLVMIRFAFHYCESSVQLFDEYQSHHLMSKSHP